MRKRAYISIEEEIIKVLIPKNQFFEVEKERLLDFLKEKEIKETIICQFLTNLISFKINLPFSQKYFKRKKLIYGIVTSEIRKRYPLIRNFAFNYQIHESNGSSYVRCYMIEEGFDIINDLIINKIDVKGFYPSFMPIVEILNFQKNILEEDYIACVFARNRRFIYVFSKKELLLQRSYDTSSTGLDMDDLQNINMTLSYSLQNLRIKPNKVIFIGIEKQEISDLSISYDFIEFPSDLSNFALAFSLNKFEKQLKGKELFNPEYKKFIERKNYLKYAGTFIGILSILLVFYISVIFIQVLENYEKIEISKKEINNYRDIISLQEKITAFDRSLKPFIQIQNKKNSEGDTKLLIHLISKASQINGIDISTIEIANKNPQKIKIVGKIIGTNNFEKQTFYLEFKNRLIGNGVKILSEQFDFIKGEFSLEGEYEFKGVL